MEYRVMKSQSLWTSYFVRFLHLPALASRSSNQKTSESLLLPILFKTAVAVNLMVVGSSFGAW